MEVDLLVTGDFRFPGGTSTAVASEVRALASAGYRVALLALATGPLPRQRGMHPAITALVVEGLAHFVPQGEAVEARLCCLHHPSVFETLPAVPPNVTCRRCILVVHHPPVDAAGAPQYDVRIVMEVTTALFGPTTWAPVGPKVREAFASLANPPPLATEDWHNIIDADDYAELRRRLPGALPVIGRHSRPQQVKWPGDRETFLGAYPGNPGVRVRLMGYAAELDLVVEERPANWVVLPFNAMPVRDFLASIDYFSYFHGEHWIEAFGRSVLEAMAAGLVCFLPPDFECLFGDGAIYCAPSEVLGHVLRFEAYPEAYRVQCERAVALVRDRFGPAHAVDRVRALIGPPAAARCVAAASRTGSVLYFTSNGIGMGHLARCMATARRLSGSITPIIVTMSKAFGVVRDEGMAVEYLPYFRSVGIGHAEWTAKVEAELSEILRYHRPNVFVFDGNVPYEGMLAALDNVPETWRVWLRRPLWRPGVGADYLKLAGKFDVVLEPGEFADSLDRGPTKPHAVDALRVPSVLFLDRDEALPRQAAKSLLGIDPDRPALLMQLGAGNNFDTRDLAEVVFDLANPRSAARDVQIVFAVWRITEHPPELPDHVRRLDAFPISRYLAAFDCAVATAGYNTFHENIAAGLPTLFVSNDHPEQDEQWLRADYAAMRGVALNARTNDVYQFQRQLDRLLRPRVQARLRAACLRLDPANGAHEAARFLEGLAHTRKRGSLNFNPAPAAAD